MSIRVVPAAPAVEITVDGKTFVYPAADVWFVDNRFVVNKHPSLVFSEGADDFTRLLLTLLKRIPVSTIKMRVGKSSWRLYRHDSDIVVARTFYERSRLGLTETKITSVVDRVWFTNGSVKFSSDGEWNQLILAADIDTLRILEKEYIL